VATATQFVQYWGLAFGTLFVAIVLLSVFYRFIDFDLDLHSLRKEAVIAAIASAVQGAGFWFSASLFHGEPFRRLIIPGAIVGIIYWLAHLEDWSGYEIGGIAFFQAAILSTGLCLASGQFKLAAIILGAFLFGLAIIASIMKSISYSCLHLFA
jgi:hypothetical protein